MNDTTNPDHSASAEQAADERYRGIENAPFVYFDAPIAHGTMGGAILIELAVRTLVPTADGGVAAEVTSLALAGFGVVRAPRHRCGIQSLRR